MAGVKIFRNIIYLEDVIIGSQSLLNNIPLLAFNETVGFYYLDLSGLIKQCYLNCECGNAEMRRCVGWS